MSTQEAESALDTIVQQTWKRARTTQEISSFLSRREEMLDEVEDDELSFEFTA